MWRMTEMGVRRYRDVSDMPDAGWLDKDDPRFFEKIAALWRFSGDLTGELPVPRGVFRFRTMEALNAHHLEWERRRVAVLRSRRAPGRP